MLVIRPESVSFGGSEWVGVERVAIESLSLDMGEAWGGAGPELVFADSVVRKTTARVVQALVGEDFGAPALGERGTLRVEVSRGSDAGRRRIEMLGVVQSVSYSVEADRSRREVRLVGLSADGTAPAVVVDGGS